jgi:predicted RNA-binding protein with RPS1 domain
MGWSRVSDTSQIVKPGEEITVKVLRVDDDKQKISLGLKQLAADPWSSVHAIHAIGQVRIGRVTRVAEFGAFVELEPGVEGLALTGRIWPGGVPDSGSFVNHAPLNVGYRPELRSKNVRESVSM